MSCYKHTHAHTDPKNTRSPQLTLTGTEETIGWRLQRGRERMQVAEAATGGGGGGRWWWDEWWRLQRGYLCVRVAATAAVGGGDG